MQPSPGEHSERSRGNARGLWARPVTQLGSRGEEGARHATPRDPPPPWAVRGPSGSLCTNWRVRCEFRDTRETLVLSCLPSARHLYHGAASERGLARRLPAGRRQLRGRRQAEVPVGAGGGAHAHGNTNGQPGPARPWGPRDRPMATGRGFSPGEAGPRAGGRGGSGQGWPDALSADALRAGSAETWAPGLGSLAETSRAQSRRHRGCSRFSDSPGPGLRGGGGATHVACLCSPGA